MCVYEADGTTHSPHCSGNYNWMATRAAFPLFGLLYFLFSPFFPIPSPLSLGLRCSLSNPIRAGRLSEGQQLQQRQLPSSPSHSLCQARTPGSLSVCVCVCVCSRVARLPDLKSQAASSETARKAATAAVNPQGLQFNWSQPREE